VTVDLIRAYVNGRGVDVPVGATAIDAVRVWDNEAAEQVMSGDRALTDSRGLPLEPTAQVVTGTIVRIVSGHRRGPAAE
jgi:hypothetical protein